MRDIIYTDRLTLSRLAAGDASFILTLLNSEGWIRFIGDRKVRTEEDAAAYVEKIMNNPNILYWVITQTDDKRPAGVVSLVKRDYLDHWDIGFALLPAFQGRQYAYESALAVLREAAATGQHTKFLATVMKENTASMALLEKLGLQFEKEIMADVGPLLLYSAPVLIFQSTYY